MGVIIPHQTQIEPGTVGWLDVTLTEAERWVEDGDHVIRSTEFDVTGAGRTFDDAFRAFTANLIDFAVYLAELGTDRAENEDEMYDLLSSRLLHAYQRSMEEERRRRPLLARVIVRRSRGDHNRWHPRSRPPSSSVPSPA